MNKIFKAVLPLVMAAVIVMCSAPFAFAAAGSYTFKVVYHQSEARSILGMINSLRTGSNAWYWEANNITKHRCDGLKALEYDYDLEKAAMQRAAELVASYSHKRPDGSDCFFYSWSNSCGENIAYGYTSAQEVQTAWEEADEGYSGQGHRRNMLNSVVTAVGIACVEYGGRKYWVQEFRNPTSPLAATPANDSETSVTVSISDSNIASKTTEASKTSFKLTEGESANLPDVYYRVKMRSTPQNTLNTKQENVSWSSSNDSVASVSGGKINALKPGTATLTAAAGSGKATVSVTVDAKKYTLTYNANGGDNAPDAVNGSGNVTITSSKPSKQGFTFEGWALSKDAASPEYKGGDSINLNGNTVLYAVWKKVPESTTKPSTTAKAETTAKETTTIKAAATASQSTQKESTAARNSTTAAQTSKPSTTAKPVTAAPLSTQSVTVITSATQTETDLSVTFAGEAESIIQEPETETAESSGENGTFYGDDVIEVETGATGEEGSAKPDRRKAVIAAGIAAAFVACAAVLFYILKH